MIPVMFAVLWGLGEADRLGVDKWEERVAAETRLRKMGVLGLVGVVKGNLSRDVEIRHRAGRLGVEWWKMVDGAEDLDSIKWRGIAVWLFFSPDQYGKAKLRRYLYERGWMNREVRKLDRINMLKLVGCARRWGLLHPGEITYAETNESEQEWNQVKGWGDHWKWSWINVARWRAAGFADVPK